MSTEQAYATLSTTPVPRALRLRRAMLRIAYGALSCYALVMASGVILLLAGKSVPDWDFMFFVSTVFKLLTLAAAVPLAWTAGRRIGAARWLALGTTVWVGTELLTAASRPFGDTVSGLLGAVVLWLAPWLLLAPERDRLLIFPPRPVVSAATIVAVPVTVGYLVWAARNTLLAPTGYPTLFPPAEALDDLRFDLTGLALAVAVYSALAVLSHSAIPARIVSAASLAVGAAAIIWRTDLGSPGLLGGIVLIIWSVLLVLTHPRRTTHRR